MTKTAKEMIADYQRTFENDYKEKFERLEKAVDDNSAAKESVEELKKNIADMDDHMTELHKSIDETNTALQSGEFTHGTNKEDKLEADYREVFNSKLIKSGNPTLTDTEQKIVTDYQTMRAKSMNVGTANQGGHLVPTGDANEIQKQVEEKVPFFGVSTVVNSGLAQTPFLIQNTKGAGAIGDETTEETNSTTATVEEIRVQAFHFEAEPWTTRELAEDSVIDVLGWVRDETADILADLLGVSIVTGSGSGAPKGILTSGGTTGTYLVVDEIDATNADNFAIGFDLDDLFTIKYSLNRRYKTAGSTTWAGGDQAIAGMRKMRTSDGIYLWQPSLTVGEPTNFDGERFLYTPNMPTLTGASDEDVLMYGNFKKGHVIVNRPDAIFMIVDEITNKKYIKHYHKIRYGANVLDARALRILRTNAAV